VTKKVDYEDDEEDENNQLTYLETLKGKFSFEQIRNKIQFSDASVLEG